jgi:hypothetical protein
LLSTSAAIGVPPPVQNFVYTYDAIGNVSGRGDLINLGFSSTAAAGRFGA